MEKGITYDYINLYNASRSPSTVHVKNTRLRNYFRKYLLQKAISVFKWNLPDEWDKDYFLYTLYGMGFIAILNTDRYGVICQQCAPGGYNLYYRPSYVIVTNPLLKETLTLDINVNCVLLKLQPDYSSIMDIVGYYADQLALASEAMGVNLVNTKSGTVFGAESKAQAEAFKVIENDLTEKEMSIYKRGRNAKVGSVPKNATSSDYHSATGLEALFGYLHLLGENKRAEELFNKLWDNFSDIL